MRILVFVLVVSMIAACANNDAIPAGIIPKQKMETIVWQLIQSDEYGNILGNRDSLKKTSAEKMTIYQQVFDLNSISLVDFKKSYLFYMEHPNISKLMFDSISARANRQHMEIYNVKKDSVKAVPVAVPAPGMLSTAGGHLKRDSLLRSKLLKSKQKQDSIKFKAKGPRRGPKINKPI